MKNSGLGSFYKNRRILVTGGAGSVGSEIVRGLLHYEIEAVRIFDNNETGLFELKEELSSEKVEVFFGDVRDKERVREATDGIDFVFHAAALKHVPLCEKNPFEAVKTNIIGTKNLIDCAIEKKVKKFITISTSKAVNPKGVMGATKLIAEKLTLSCNFSGETIFSCVRFGNVLGSRGSVTSIFRRQIGLKGPVRITNPEMTRFFVGKSEVAKLIIKVCKIARGGEIFVLNSGVFRIKDLADVMIEELAPLYGYNPSDIRIEIIGKREGEKLHEELLTEDEAKGAFKKDDIFFVLPGNFKKFFLKGVGEKISSQNLPCLTKEKIKKILKREKII